LTIESCCGDVRGRILDDGGTGRFAGSLGYFACLGLRQDGTLGDGGKSTLFWKEGRPGGEFVDLGFQIWVFEI
jgi:hypothetical protein